MGLSKEQVSRYRYSPETHVEEVESALVFSFAWKLNENNRMVVGKTEFLLTSTITSH